MVYNVSAHYFDPDAWCHKHTVNYSHPIDDPEHFNFCPVPERGFDALLYMSLALLVAACLQGKLSALMVLVAGGALQAVAYSFNLGFLGNSINLWLGIEPAELFLYGFLPVLILDSAVGIDYFMLKKVAVKVMTFAFLVVLSTTALMVPTMLFGFQLGEYWDWAQAALFVAIIASTDAVTINALLKSGGGPEEMVALMEGESLFNDASSMVLFDVFFTLSSKADPGPVLQQLPVVAQKVVMLSAGGALVGYINGYVTRKMLGWMQSRGCKPSQEVAIVIAMSFASFYVSQAVFDVSGVVAVAVFGIYGASTGKWEMSRAAVDGGVFQGFMESLSFGVNGLVFFYAGSSSVNFLLRSIHVLIKHEGLIGNLVLLVGIYVAMFFIRFICILFFNQFFAMANNALPWNAMLFATVGGLRGALSLIMAQVVIQDRAREHSRERQAGHEIDIVTAQVVLWSAGFVLMTLLINAPLIPWFMRKTGMVKTSGASLVLRSKAKRALIRFTATAIQDLKADEDEMLRGVDWKHVHTYTNMSKALASFGTEEGAKEDASGPEAGGGGNRLSNLVSTGLGGVSRVPAGGRASSLARIPSLQRPLLVDEEDGRRGAPNREDDDDDDGSDGEGGPMFGTEVPLSSHVPAKLKRKGAGAGVPTDGVPVSANQRRSMSAELVVDVPPTDVAAQQQQQQLRPPTVPAQKQQQQQQAYQIPEVPGLLAIHTARHASPAGGDGQQYGLMVPQLVDGQQNVESVVGEWIMASDLGGALPSIDTGECVAPGSGLGAGQPKWRPRFTTSNAGSSNSPRTSQDTPGGHSKSRSLSLQDDKAELEGRLSSRSAFAPGSSNSLRSNNSSSRGNGHKRLQRNVSSMTMGMRLLRPSTSVDGPEEGGASRSGSMQSPFESNENVDTTTIADGSIRVSAVDIIAEARMRLVSGFKRFLHMKRSEGLLSSRGLRLLDYACDLAIDHPERPLDVWATVESEVAGRTWVTFLAHLHFHVLRMHQALRIPGLHQLLGYWSGYLSSKLSSKMLLSCETAVSYYLALTHSTFAQWLRDSDSHVLQEELLGETADVWKFIIDREVEAPERFQAIQSYRAAMAVLHQQLHFVHELYLSGMVDEAEKEMMAEPIEHKIMTLEHAGATWRAPRWRMLLRSLPFFAHLPEHVFESVVNGGAIKSYKSSDVIMTPLHAEMHSCGVFVVINGLVKGYLRHGHQVHEYFLGSGGIFGLIEALTAMPMYGTSGIAAEGNALGKGPVLFHLPLDKVQEIQARSAGGDQDYQQLELDLYRMTVLYTLERTKNDVLLSLQHFYSRFLLQKAAEKKMRSPALPSKHSGSSLPGVGTTAASRQPAGPRGASTTRATLGGRSMMLRSRAAEQQLEDLLEEDEEEIEGALNSTSAVAAAAADTAAAATAVPGPTNGVPPKVGSGSSNSSTPFSNVAATAPTASSAAVHDKAVLQACQQQARKMAAAAVQSMREELGSAMLVEAPAGSVLHLQSHVVLLKGSLVATATTRAAGLSPSRATAGAGGTGSGGGQQQPLTLHFKSPFVLPWAATAQLMEKAGAGQVAAPIPVQAIEDSILVVCHRSGHGPGDVNEDDEDDKEDNGEGGKTTFDGRSDVLACLGKHSEAASSGSQAPPARQTSAEPRLARVYSRRPASMVVEQATVLPQMDQVLGARLA